MQHSWGYQLSLQQYPQNVLLAGYFAVTVAMIIDFAAGMAASAKEAVEHPNNKKVWMEQQKE